MKYAHESGDLTLLATCLAELSDAFDSHGQLDKSLHTYRQAERYNKELSGFLQSMVLVQSSLPHARQGESQEVFRCLGEGWTRFEDADDQTPVFLLESYGRSTTILFEGWSTLHLGNHAKDQGNSDRALKYWKDAAGKLGKMEQLPSHISVPVRIAAHVLIGQALAYAKAGDMEGFLTAFEKGFDW